MKPNECANIGSHVWPRYESQVFMERNVSIQRSDPTSWEAFHRVEYGRNMDAWIDCMSSLHEVAGVTDVRLAQNEGACLEIRGFKHFAGAAGEIASALLDFTAFVNRRYAERNSRTRIAIVPM